ncbi:hypothetical protein D5R81_04945 [Parashewanella spongiae]|uniref:DUF1653 domain-containing protein n=1 Tax=Parashewanella spongiae TaxID=342950 RepID=A0A3A6TZI9_9GAMM|nr:DUF5397 family protein [Parashewanella spongiae]MCL1077256.1 DUF5397 domain-containing protein [Parashewanella spongiae]RJY18560.1 hypothetical protein D5R81_04945 [Parashewanella spongiae]
MLNDQFPSPDLIGEYRQFGEMGPAYKIVRPVRRVDKDDWVLLIEVLETGEETEYRFSKVKNDPKVH